MGLVYEMPSVFIFIIILFDMGRSELYPSVQWTYLNPIFASNRTQCVYPMSTLYFLCPNTVTIVTRLHSSSYLGPQYENLWLVSEQGYERCEVNKQVDKKLIVCDKPFNLNYRQVTFNKYSADSSEPEFVPGKDYYFIATSDGTKSSIDDISGGHCKTHNMKLKFHICANNTDPLCQSDELCNGVVPTRAKTTATTTKQTTTAVTTHTVKNTSITNYTVPTTRINTPGDPENDRMSKETTYLITIGFLVFMCLCLLIISAFLIYRLNRNRKPKAPPSSRGSASSHDSPDGGWGEELLLGVKSL